MRSLITIGLRGTGLSVQGRSYLLVIRSIYEMSWLNMAFNVSYELIDAARDSGNAI